MEQAGYQLEIPDAAGLELLFSSDLPEYGGKGRPDLAAGTRQNIGRAVFEFTLAPFSAEYYLIKEK